MDISNLTLSELRVLRNALPARQGYCFMTAELRSLFGRTSWYNDTLYNRWEQDADKPFAYTAREQQFMKRLKQREDELRRHNFTPDGRPVMANLVNPYQVENMPGALATKLAANGFAIVENDYEQLFHVYEKNDYTDFPSFVTTDLFAQAFHVYFDCLVRKIEQRQLYGDVEDLTRRYWTLLDAQARRAPATSAGQAAQYCADYFAIAHTLLTGKQELPFSAAGAAAARREIDNVHKAQTAPSDFLDFTTRPFMYDTFRPRGHYTRCDSLSRYFQAMMWLQAIPFIIDNDKSLQRAVVMACVANGDDGLRASARLMGRYLDFLMGDPDNVALADLERAVAPYGTDAARIIADKKAMAAIRKAMMALSKSRTRIVPKEPAYSIYRLNFLPQRYQPDAEVLQEMVDYKHQPSQRQLPSGLDVLAAMGNEAALALLGETQGARWDGFAAAMARMRALMAGHDYGKSFASMWLKAVGHAADHTKVGTSFPYFMQGGMWARKELNTALASWAELKHDAILYAKQPMGAECGAAGPPDPVVKGYVEPNNGYWAEAEAMLRAAREFLYGSEGLDDMREATDKLLDMATFLHRIGLKEMTGEPLVPEEYDQIEHIGAQFENLSLNLLRDPDQYLQAWSDVEGTDRNVALAADVYTANAENNPEPSVLYGAVGPADEIYVVVEVNGYLYLMRGAVLSYREFSCPLSEPRLTDGVWQQMLKQEKRLGVPTWMRDITVPSTGSPADNETIFYGTGC